MCVILYPRFCSKCLPVFRISRTSSLPSPSPLRRHLALPQVVANCKALAARMTKLGYTVVSGGTDNHLILVDLKPNGIDGARVQSVLDEVSM